MSDVRRHWIVIDRGCVECGEDDILVGVRHDKGAAERLKVIYEGEHLKVTTRVVILREGGRE